MENVVFPRENRDKIEKSNSEFIGGNCCFLSENSFHRLSQTVFGDIKTSIFALDRGITHWNSKFKIHNIMATKKAKKKSTRKPSAAFMKPLTPSAALAEVVGSKPLPRTEVVKKMWGYIKKNKLQDSKNRRMINADAKLKPIFSGKNQVSMFDMAKHLAKNLK